MVVRATVCVLAALAVLSAACLAVVRQRSAPDPEHPVTVGDVRLDGAALRADAHHRDRPVAASAEAATELAWLRGEAAARRMPIPRGLAQARRAVGAAIAAEAADRVALVRAFGAFHARWRERTVCLEGYADPYTDRCSNLVPAADGSCHWMGAAWLCRTARAWTVVRGNTSTRRRTRDAAGALIWAMHRRASAARARAARAERAAEERADSARKWEARSSFRGPAVSAATVADVAPVCRRYARTVEAYRFGMGLQDPGGAAHDVRAARARGRRSLRAAIRRPADRRKLRPLVAAMRSTDRALASVEAAAVNGGRLDAALRDYEAAAGREQRAAADAALGSCLAAPQ